MVMHAPLMNHQKRGPSDREAPFCTECGRLFTGRTTELTWNGAAHPWWAWVLIALGATLTFTFGLEAWQSARERAATQEILRGLPAWETRLEGPSVQRAALQTEAPPGPVDRYLVAEHHLDRAVVETAVALTTVVLGIGLLARRSVERRGARHSTANGDDKLPALFDPVRHILLEGWVLAETLALSAFRLLTVAFLYLLIVRVSSGETPTLSVVQETLDRLIIIVIPAVS
jgi:hypothetical protein